MFNDFFEVVVCEPPLQFASMGIKLFVLVVGHLLWEN